MNEKQIEDIMKLAGKKVAKQGGKLLLKLIAPYLPVIGCAFFIFMLLAMLIGAVYSAFPNSNGRQVGILAGVDQSQKDIEMYNKYEKLCNKYNVEDTWVVNYYNPSTPGGDNYESSPESAYYPGGGVRNIHSFCDTYNNDYELRLLWSQVHAATLYRAYSLNEIEIKNRVMEKVAEDLHPYFYYKKSEVISCGKDGCYTDTVYLLVEAYTIQGHYQYHYKWVARPTGNGGSITREELWDTRQILPEKHQRLDGWMKKEYKLESDEESISIARTALLQAAQGFYNKKEWMNWLTKVGGASWISGTMVPAELRPFFDEASQRFGIPSWFLAAVAMKESTFKASVYGTDGTGSYGLMQVLPENWKRYAPLLGFDASGR